MRARSEAARARLERSGGASQIEGGEEQEGEEEEEEEEEPGKTVPAAPPGPVKRALGLHTLPVELCGLVAAFLVGGAAKELQGAANTCRAAHAYMDQVTAAAAAAAAAAAPSQVSMLWWWRSGGGS